jgi:hypothetical protein
MNDLFVVAGELACVMCGGNTSSILGRYAPARSLRRSANCTAFKRRQVQNTRASIPSLFVCLDFPNWLLRDSCHPRQTEKVVTPSLAKYLLCIIISVALCATQKKLKGASRSHVFICAACSPDKLALSNLFSCRLCRLWHCTQTGLYPGNRVLLCAAESEIRREVSIFALLSEVINHWVFALEIANHLPVAALLVYLYFGPYFFDASSKKIHFM